MAAIFILLTVLLAGDIPVNPDKMKAGESACVYPLHFTVEHNVWINPKSVYRRTDQPCIFTLVRTKTGWRIKLNGIPVNVHPKDAPADAELELYEWLKLGPPVRVLNP